MRPLVVVLVLGAFVSLFAGCPSKSSSPIATEDRGASATIEAGGGSAEPSVDAPGADGSDDASSASSATSTSSIAGCGVKQAKNADACDEDCGARLTLPAGGSFCTVECGKDEDCAAPGADLACPSTIGACMPRCTTDAACQAGGFARCDLETGACDTL